MPEPETTDSTAVRDFILSRQTVVLDDAIDVLRHCSQDDLRAELHRVSGAVGSFELDEAYEVVMGLRTVVEDEARSPGEVEGVRSVALQQIEGMRAGLSPATGAGGHR